MPRTSAEAARIIAAALFFLAVGAAWAGATTPANQTPNLWRIALITGVLGIAVGVAINRLVGNGPNVEVSPTPVDHQQGVATSDRRNLHEPDARPVTPAMPVSAPRVEVDTKQTPSPPRPGPVQPRVVKLPPRPDR